MTFRLLADQASGGGEISGSDGGAISLEENLPRPVRAVGLDDVGRVEWVGKWPRREAGTDSRSGRGGGNGECLGGARMAVHLSGGGKFHSSLNGVQVEEPVGGSRQL